MQLLVDETNRYYQQYLEKFDEGPSPKPDVTMTEMYLLLAIILQMGHDVRDSLRDYWSTLHQFNTPFYSSTIRRDRFLHILRFLHFSDNSKEPNKDDEDYDRLWKIRALFDMLNDSYAKFYFPSEHLAVDEVIVLFKGRVVFRQYIPKKHKRFGIKVYKLCDDRAYTYDMKVYLGKDRLNLAKETPATQATVRSLTRRVEGVGHKLYMDNFFSSPNLFDELKTKKYLLLWHSQT
ncbi:hypothetical protein J437_LFUL008051 [Ladona fulva]|uniref:PiggyBac transposable element-derived protein domain-containing protein n=1 Tax=Ladona fulva TaxID=123851 RepID=A0A8K0KEL2_LADFU|nr:hypothetical protein J437_LFUL008051 [Ladona fulva]